MDSDLVDKYTSNKQPGHIHTKIFFQRNSSVVNHLIKTKVNQNFPKLELELLNHSYISTLITDLKQTSLCISISETLLIHH